MTQSLLSPAYEPGDGSAVGAQLVDGEWWHPVFGCDSLQDVVDNARAAIALDRSRRAPQPPAEGEVAELVDSLISEAGCEEVEHRCATITAPELRRAAELLQLQQAEIQKLWTDLDEEEAK